MGKGEGWMHKEMIAERRVDRRVDRRVLHCVMWRYQRVGRLSM